MVAQREVSVSTLKTIHQDKLKESQGSTPLNWPKRTPLEPQSTSPDPMLELEKDK
jgi:hypothetical protein